jgi:pimeloyl-ACP methyl ester carboxylesterase
MCSGPQALTGPRVELLPLMAPVLEQGGMPALVDAVEALGADDPRNLALSPEVREFLRVRMLASSPAGLLGMAAGLTGEPDRVAELRATDVPTLVLHGAADDAWSPAGAGRHGRAPRRPLRRRPRRAALARCREPGSDRRSAERLLRRGRVRP